MGSHSLIYLKAGWWESKGPGIRFSCFLILLHILSWSLFICIPFLSIAAWETLEQGAPYPFHPSHSASPTSLYASHPVTLSYSFSPSQTFSHSFTVLPIPSSPSPSPSSTPTQSHKPLNPPYFSHSSQTPYHLRPLQPIPFVSCASSHCPLISVPLPHPFTSATLLSSHLLILHTLLIPLALPHVLYPPYSHLPYASRIGHTHTHTLTHAHKPPHQTAFCPVAAELLPVCFLENLISSLFPFDPSSAAASFYTWGSASVCPPFWNSLWGREHGCLTFTFSPLRAQPPGAGSWRDLPIALGWTCRRLEPELWFDFSVLSPQLQTAYSWLSF